MHPLIESERGLPSDIVVVESEVELLIANVNVKTIILDLEWTQANDTVIGRIRIGSWVDERFDCKAHLMQRNKRCEESLSGGGVEQGSVAEDPGGEGRHVGGDRGMVDVPGIIVGPVEGPKCDDA